MLGFPGRRHELFAPIEIGAAYDKLRAAVGWPVFSDRSIVGLLDRYAFHLRVNIWYRNSFQTILHGAMWAEGSGTRISCRARMSIFSICFMTVWFGFLFFIIALIDTSGDASTKRSVEGAVIPSLMVMFGVGLIVFCRWIARDEEDQLLAFLSDVIGAEPVR